MRRERRIAAVAAGLALALPAVAHAGTAPALVGSVSDPVHLSNVDAVTVSGSIAYAAAYDSGELTAVDFSNPISPQIVSGNGPTAPLQTNLIGGSNVAIAGGYAFVTSKNRNGPCMPGPAPTNCGSGSNDDGNGNSLTILDIHSNPDVPKLVGTVRDAFGTTSTDRLFGAYGIAVQGNYAYVAYQGLLSGQPSGPDTSRGGFTVIDITNPAGPTIVANIDDNSLTNNQLNHATSVAISGHYAFVNSFASSYVTVIDILNPTAPKILFALHDPTNLTFVADLAIQGNYLYTANQIGGSAPQLTVIDISNPTSPRVVATLSDPNLSGAYRIRVRGDFVYESASNVASVGVIDISDPLHPRLAGFVNDPAHLHFTTGLDVDPAGQYVVASSPYSKTTTPPESNVTYPPYPDSSSTAPTNTGTISVIQLDPNPIQVTIAPGSEPPSLTLQNSASFSFSTNDDISAAQCQLDSGPLGPCSAALPAGGASYSGLAPGSHTFTVQATDAAGHTSTQSYTWTVGAVPANTSTPTISDTAPVQGETITAGGAWSGTPQPTLSYQWNRCGPSGANCGPIAGATSQTYVVQPADVSSLLQVVVTATNALGSSPPAGSQPTSPVVAARVANTPPVNTVPPVISGTAVLGQTLIASAGGWGGYPAPILTVQWERCNSPGQPCSPIPGATSAAYKLAAPDVGQTLRFSVRGSNAVGSAFANSAPTRVVQPAATATAALTGVTRGSPQLTIAIHATTGGAALNRVSVALPSGMSFVHQKRLLTRALRVLGASGKRVRFTVTQRGGALIIVVRQPARSLKLVFSGQAFAVAHTFRTKARHNHGGHVRVALAIGATNGITTSADVNLRVS